MCKIKAYNTVPQALTRKSSSRWQTGGRKSVNLKVVGRNRGAGGEQMKVARRQSQQSDTSISSPGKSLGSKHSRTAEPGNQENINRGRFGRGRLS